MKCLSTRVERERSTRLKDDALFASCNWGDERQRNVSAAGSPKPATFHAC